MFDNTDLSIQQHIHSSLSSAYIASQLCTQYSLLAFMGSASVLHNQAGCESMISYSICKSMIHQLVKSLSLEHNGLPRNTNAIAISPYTLLTPNNRKFMPDSNFGNWTSCDTISELLCRFTMLQQNLHYNTNIQIPFNEQVDNIELVNGGIYECITKDNITKFIIN